MDKVPENANEGCPGLQDPQAGKKSGCEGCPNQKQCDSGEMKFNNQQTEIFEKMKQVKHKILVLSGKGGVGKSTVSSQISLGLAEKGYEIGVLDLDLCGPSIPRMLGVENEEVHQSNEGWEPVSAHDNIGVMSIGFLLNNKNDAVIWRGPRKNGLIKQFLTDVTWGNLDYLIIDTPPGTSDEHISITQMLQLDQKQDGAIIVTTPQEVSLSDVRKEISFCRKTNTNIIGVVENMRGFICPCCNTESVIFAPTTGGAQILCKEQNIPLITSIPLDPQINQYCDQGLFVGQQNSQVNQIVIESYNKIIQIIENL